MRRLITLTALLFCVTVNIQGEENTRSISDGATTIHYTSVAEAEDKLLEYIQAHNDRHSFPSKLFANLILNDDRCYSYDFTRIIEASETSTVRPLRIKTSNDGKLRLYSWDADGGTISCYSGITSYINADEVHSHVSPIGIDEWATCDGNNPSTLLGFAACGVTGIETRQDKTGNNIYLIQTHNCGLNSMHQTAFSAYKIDHDGLKPCEIFPGEYGYTSWIQYTHDPSDSENEGISLSGNVLTMRETAREIDSKFLYYRLTDRTLIYKYNGDKFKLHKKIYPDNLFKWLCNFSHNIKVINTGEMILRLDQMPYGYVRLALWNSKSQNEKPDVVIPNYTERRMSFVSNESVSTPTPYSSTVREKVTYYFHNKEYQYEVSWIIEDGTDIPLQQSWNVVVKCNDEVIMNIVPNN